MTEDTASPETLHLADLDYLDPGYQPGVHRLLTLCGRIFLGKQIIRTTDRFRHRRDEKRLCQKCLDKETRDQEAARINILHGTARMDQESATPCGNCGVNPREVIDDGDSIDINIYCTDCLENELV